MPYKDIQKKREAQRTYRETHRAELRARAWTYRQSHLEQEKVRGQAYDRAHHEQRQVQHRAYYLTHQEALRKYSRDYQKAHPVQLAVANARRRARKSGLPATFTLQQWEAIQTAYRHRCAYCGKRSNHLTQDHVIPIANGGGTTPENIVPACRTCNSSKGAGKPWVLPTVRLLV